LTRIRSLFGWLWQHKVMTIAVLAVLGLVAGTTGSAVGLALEEHDDFCASCHTQPEYDFYMRTQTVAHPYSTVNITDLATFHMVPAAENKDPNRAPVQCISCHGGANIVDRLQTEFTLGVLDSVKFVALDIMQPSKLSNPLPNSYCQQCHQPDVDRTGFDNHYHNKLTDPKAPPLNCTSCHVAHAEADSLNKYILREAAYPNCNMCHKLMGGPTNLR
jgi:nitrate/TMAO reductase-like tetraheme cytochrome c subunit